ncbi:MAG: PD-(D/E)XK nuclease family protein [Clostridium sp.]
MDIIRGLGIGYKEDIISNLLVEAINESKIFRKSFLENLLKIENSEIYEVKAKARLRTNEGVPDIVIKLQDSEKTKVIIIENKLSASEGSRQTERYGTEGCFKKICEKNNIEIAKKDFKSISRKYIFLTLLEEMAEDVKFENITYKELVEAVNFDVEDTVMKIILDSFKSFLGEFYINSEVNLNSKVSEVMNSNVDKVILQVRAKNIFKHINLNRNSYKINFLKFDSKATKNVGIQIYKKHWNDKKIKENECEISDKTFNIHFEPMFNVVNGAFGGLVLHYETNPYYTKETIEKLSESGVKKYKENREKFKKFFSENIEKVYIDNLKLGSTWLQILNVKIDIRNLTVREFLNILEINIEKISDVVDDTLGRINNKQCLIN